MDTRALRKSRMGVSRSFQSMRILHLYVVAEGNWWRNRSQKTSRTPLKKLKATSFSVFLFKSKMIRQLVFAG